MSSRSWSGRLERYRCVPRGWPRIRQARRSGTFFCPKRRRTRSTVRRRRSGSINLGGRLPGESGCPRPGQPPTSSAGHSLIKLGAKKGEGGQARCHPGTESTHAGRRVRRAHGFHLLETAEHFLPRWCYGITRELITSGPKHFLRFRHAMEW